VGVHSQVILQPDDTLGNSGGGRQVPAWRMVGVHSVLLTFA